MSAYTTPSCSSQPWWSSSELLDMLSAMAPDGTHSSPVASSSEIPMDHVQTGAHTATSSVASSPSCTPAYSDNLSRHWHPCTGEQTIGDYLNSFRLPVSYRELVYRWEDAGSPPLQSLRAPFGVCSSDGTRNPNQCDPLDLHTITEVQERAVMVAINEYFQRGLVTSQSRLFVHFASYLDIYTSLHVELMAMQEGWSLEQQTSAYESTWRDLLGSFDRDRSNCMSSESHGCLHQLLWGEVCAWPVAEIKRCFKAYKRRSTSSKSRSAISMPASPLLSAHPRSALAHAWSEAESWIHTPRLSVAGSNSSSGSVKASGLSPSEQSSPSILASPIASVQANSSCNPFLLRPSSTDFKQWPESSMMLQALQNIPSIPTVGSDQASEHRRSRSSSHPAPLQLSQLRGGLVASHSDSSLNASAAGSPQSSDASMLVGRFSPELHGLQSSWSAELVVRDHPHMHLTEMWMQHHRTLLQDAATQLDLAAQLLSAKASRLRVCTTEQHPWVATEGASHSRPVMRRHHTVSSAT